MPKASKKSTTTTSTKAQRFQPLALANRTLRKIESQRVATLLYALGAHEFSFLTEDNVMHLFNTRTFQSSALDLNESGNLQHLRRTYDSKSVQQEEKHEEDYDRPSSTLNMVSEAVDLTLHGNAMLVIAPVVSNQPLCEFTLEFKDHTLLCGCKVNANLFLVSSTRVGTPMLTLIDCAAQRASRIRLQQEQPWPIAKMQAFSLDPDRMRKFVVVVEQHRPQPGLALLDLDFEVISTPPPDSNFQRKLFGAGIATFIEHKPVPGNTALVTLVPRAWDQTHKPAGSLQARGETLVPRCWSASMTNHKLIIATGCMCEWCHGLVVVLDLKFEPSFVQKQIPHGVSRRGFHDLLVCGASSIVGLDAGIAWVFEI